MRFLIYASPFDTSARNIINSLPIREHGPDTVFLPSLEDFETYLRQPSHLAELIMLVPKNQQELDALIAIGDLVRDAKVILVLPENDRAINTRSHLLRPRFITYSDTDTSRLTAVVHKMIGTQPARSVETVN